jgi:hypothetical protein
MALKVERVMDSSMHNSAGPTLIDCAKSRCGAVARPSVPGQFVERCAAKADQTALEGLLGPPPPVPAPRPPPRQSARIKSNHSRASSLFAAVNPHIGIDDFAHDNY